MALVDFTLSKTPDDFTRQGLTLMSERVKNEAVTLDMPQSNFAACCDTSCNTVFSYPPPPLFSQHLEG